MTKTKSVAALFLCTGFLLSASIISNHTSANAGYALTKCMGGGAQAFATGAGGAAGGLGAAYAGAKIGGKIGAIVGGPVGVICGAGLGAL